MVAGNKMFGPDLPPDTDRTLTTTMLSGLKETSGLDYDIRFSVGLVLMAVILLCNLILNYVKKRWESTRIKITSGNLKKRRIKDTILNGITYLSSGISVLVLAAIFIFVFTQGFSSLSLDLLTGNYWANNYLTTVEADRNAPDCFQVPKELGEEVAFSEAWGVGFVDALDENKEPIVLIEYIDEASLLQV